MMMMMMMKFLESVFLYTERAVVPARSECIRMISSVRKQVVEDVSGILQNCSE